MKKLFLVIFCLNMAFIKNECSDVSSFSSHNSSLLSPVVQQNDPYAREFSYTILESLRAENKELKNKNRELDLNLKKANRQKINDQKLLNTVLAERDLAVDVANQLKFFNAKILNESVALKQQIERLQVTIKENEELKKTCECMTNEMQRFLQELGMFVRATQIMK